MVLRDQGLACHPGAASGHMEDWHLATRSILDLCCGCVSVCVKVILSASRERPGRETRTGPTCACELRSVHGPA